MNSFGKPDFSQTPNKPKSLQMKITIPTQSLPLQAKTLSTQTLIKMMMTLKTMMMTT
jgi:hypothetical protein